MTRDATLWSMRDLHRLGASGRSMGTFRIDLDGSITADTGAAVGQVKDGRFRRAAAYEGPKWPVDLMQRIETAARKFDLSADPRTYLFDAGRANTATVPNDNHLAFPKDELLSRRASTGRKTYQSYIGAPHHMEHQTDNPKDARGFVLDAEYWDKTAAASKCPACGLNPRRRANRRANGIQCLCGTPVKDEYVAALIAIDSLKDPGYASAVERGELPYWSMGCGIGRIACSLDGKSSATDAGTCKHIRGSNLGRLWLVDGDGARQITKAEAEGLARAADLRFVPQDFMELVLDRDVSLPEARRIARSYEVAQSFEYDDLSNVMVGGDRRATRSETLSARRREAAGRSTQMSKETENSVPAVAPSDAPGKQTRQAMRYTVVRVNGDPSQTYAAESLAAAMDMARPDVGDTAQYAEVEAADSDAARMAMEDAADILDVPTSMMGGEMERDSDVVVQAPSDEAVVIQPPTNGAPEAAGEAPGMEPNMGDIQSPLDELPNMAPEDMGVESAQPNMEQPAPAQPAPAQPAMPRQMSLNFEKHYRDWDAKTSRKAGLILLRTPDGTSAAHFRMRQASAGAPVTITGDDVKKSLYEVGLTATLERYAGKLVADLSRLAMQGISDENPVQGDLPDAPAVQGGPIHEGQSNDIKEQETSEVDPSAEVGEPEMDIKPVSKQASKDNDEDDESQHAGVEDDQTGGGKESLNADVIPASAAASCSREAASELEAREEGAKEALNEGAGAGDSETPVNEPLKDDPSKRVAALTAAAVETAVAEVDAKYRRAARLAKERADVETRRRVAAAKEAVKLGIQRGIAVEFKRVALNMSKECGTYDEIARMISSSSEVGRDAAGRPIVYDGLHNKMARRIASQLMQEPILRLVNHLLDKGLQSLDYDEAVLMQREADLNGMRLPDVEFESQEEASVARTARSQAALEADQLRERFERSAASGGVTRVDHGYQPPRRSRPAPTDSLDDALSTLGLGASGSRGYGFED